MTYVLAGHPYPMARRVDGSVEELGRGGLPLGLREGVDSPTGEFVIAPGEQLLLYTDGFVETLDPAGADFGFDRLRRALALGGSAGAVHDRIVREVTAFQGDGPAHDDRSLVVVSRTGGLPPLP